jgi:hypothetical protein
VFWRLVRVVGFALAAVAVVVYLGVASMHIPGTPSYTALRLANSEKATVGAFLLASEAKLWFGAVVSGISGVLLGVCLRFLPFWHRGELYSALMVVSVVLVLMNGIGELAAWCGALLFAFALLGGLNLILRPWTIGRRTRTTRTATA